MKVWCGVYLYGGLINDIVSFDTREKALNWFNSIAWAVDGDIQDGNGYPIVCEEGDYAVEDTYMKFYDSLGRQDTEVFIQLVEVK